MRAALGFAYAAPMLLHVSLELVAPQPTSRNGRSIESRPVLNSSSMPGKTAPRSTLLTSNCAILSNWAKPITLVILRRTPKVRPSTSGVIGFPQQGSRRIQIEMGMLRRFVLWAPVSASEKPMPSSVCE